MREPDHHQSLERLAAGPELCQADHLRGGRLEGRTQEPADFRLIAGKPWRRCLDSGCHRPRRCQTRLSNQRLAV